MADPKRRKLSKCNISESGNLGECSYSSHNVIIPHVATSFKSQCYITRLPNEAIIYIYSYLTPVDLSAMAQIGDNRLKDLTFYIEHANFSSCRKANPKYIAEFFTRRRVKDIKKLNLSYVMSLRSRTITNLICRCKNLTVLSIVECGVNYQSLSKIIVNCPKLETLYWNLDAKMAKDEWFHSNIKYAYLFCEKLLVCVEALNFILNCLSNAKCVWLHCATDAVSALPFHGVWLKASSVVNHSQTKRISLISNSFRIASYKNVIGMLSIHINVILKEPFRKESYDVVGDFVDCRTFAFGPTLQIKSNVEDVSELSKKPCSTFSTVSIILTPEILDVSESLAKSVAQASGLKMRQLSLQSEAYHFADSGTAPMPISSEESLTVCDVLDKFADSCKFITDLNLITVHFTIGSPFKAISKLRFLKTLHLPSCAFFKSYNKVLEKNLLDSEPMRFEDVVSNCILVETFSLFCCRDDYGQLADTDLYAMKDWKELKYLTIYSIVVRTCYFLRKVADSCKKFQSLSLIGISPNNMCIYTSDVIYVLKNAKILSFIRINEENFNPMYERFWDAVGEASNLEGICIITNSRTYIDRPKVVASVRKLKYLKMFHFFAKQTTERLFSEVKRSMQNNGICYLNVEANCYTSPNVRCAQLEYYHSEPHFCCQHIHFRDFVTYSGQNG